MESKRVFFDGSIGAGISGLRYCDTVRAQKIQAGPWLRKKFLSG